MPKRPRQHQLEDQSRIAFQDMLPRKWVFRDVKPDYGIDATVELFDDSDNSTGRMFNVQLKATDRTDLNKALKISLRKDTIRYYQSLDVPVLIVRYHAPNNSLYVKWFHSFDPYYARRGAKTVTFQLSPKDQWDTDTSDRLRSDLEAIKRLKSRELNLPMQFALVFKDANVQGIPSGQIASKIREIGESTSNVLKFVTGGVNSSDRLRILIDDAQTVIDLAGIKSVTLHTQNYPPSSILTNFPNDILVSVGIALDTAGYTSEAAKLIANYAPNSALIEHTEMSIMMATCMAHASRIPEALQLAESLFEKSGKMEAALFFSLGILRQTESFGEANIELLRQFMFRRIQRAQEANDKLNAATWHYNLGNHFRSSRLFRKALHHYRIAAKCDPTYHDREYFWRELGGVLFELGHYETAAKSYARALDKNDKGDCRPLYADALMFAGKYLQAEKEFRRYLKKAKKSAWQVEWRLKAEILRFIRKFLGANEQMRRRILAKDELGAIEIETLAQDDKTELLTRILSFDALQPTAWFNLGVLWNNTGERDNALSAFLAAALCRRNDLGAWCNAIALGFSLKAPRETLATIIVCAYLINGEQLMEQFVKFAQSQPSDFPAEQFINAFNTLLSAIQKPQESFEIRFVNATEVQPTRKKPRDSFFSITINC